MVNEASICEEIGTTQLLSCSGDRFRFVTMLRSDGSQGQPSLREALTVATTGGYGYMQRCHDNMRSEQPKYDGNFTAGTYLPLSYCLTLLV